MPMIINSSPTVLFIWLDFMVLVVSFFTIMHKIQHMATYSHVAKLTLAVLLAFTIIKIFAM